MFEEFYRGMGWPGVPILVVGAEMGLLGVYRDRTPGVTGVNPWSRPTDLREEHPVALMREQGEFIY